MTRFTRLLAAVVLTVVPVGSAVAQTNCSSAQECSATVFDRPGLHQEMAIAGANALLGGVAAAASRIVRGEPVWDGFWKGAVGGGVTYAGKRVAVERFYGAGLVGRQLASVGGSMTRNAGAGRGLLDEVALPVGPVRLYVSAGGVVPRVDLPTLIAAGAFVATYDARLDAAASFSAGALVFRGATPLPGLTGAGAMTVWADMPPSEGPRLMAHERIHILQYDQMLLAWDALDRWTARRTPVVGGLLENVDLGVAAVGIRTGLALALDYHARPWETEAYFLAQRAYPVATTGSGH